ncbi:MAG TPA: hypothetical protein VM889_04770 [Candidatus Thermoplasmatota archaeon]|jgi:uncharacterized membrane protein (DUF2068 family)|nr:hypothetical protein [Candidatus Thermoplasmatota archaeon]
MKRRAERPLGITILAVVFGVLSIPFFLGAIQSGAALAALGPVGLFLAMLQLLVPEGFVIAAFGLWRMRRWGWLVAIATLVILAFLYFEALIEGGISARTVGRLSVPIALIAYLAHPRMRVRFS